MNRSVKELYSFNEKGWRTYEIDKMSFEETKVVSETCPKEALAERIKTGLLVGGFIVTLAASGFATFALTKIAICFFGEIVAKAGVAFEILIPKSVDVLSRVLGAGSTLTLSAYGIRKLWKEGISKITSSWGYANHLDQQANDALLRNGHLAHLSKMS